MNLNSTIEQESYNPTDDNIEEAFVIAGPNPEMDFILNQLNKDPRTFEEVKAMIDDLDPRFYEDYD